MKKYILTFLAIISLSLSSSAQQVTLFDSSGEAIAYIDYDEDATIFMWSGKPVAFIEKDGDDLCIIGFNRSFLGWYEDGIIYDRKGYIVGGTKDALNIPTKFERMKRIQGIVPFRPITPISPIKPTFWDRWSNTPLTEFLFFGKK
ncbi:hypothetical protein NAT51_05405 [Flavobacterium amniphilum]|uniref:4-fold beta flower protein n=1 Tax=Flavobacterium amniphilum TaxID=1834035 RepID=UPI00202A1D2F|nr:hypothetical protein [Flavobacterium amniphilum]MCL9804943.1 hypothetical protein [Flavobacterium amniphilum]